MAMAFGICHLFLRAFFGFWVWFRFWIPHIPAFYADTTAEVDP